jgi:hypothetical protein
MVTSRELSARVEIDVHRRPNKFRRRTWWGSVWLSALCLAWLAYEGARGEYQIFEGGEVATPHKLFENDCGKCHESWTGLDRVIELDGSDKVYSVTNSKCLECHPGSLHNHERIKGHIDLDISCAQCHIEHIGDHDLKRVADQTCVNCHADLSKVTKPNPSPKPPFQYDPDVTAFDQIDGHPEFAFERLSHPKHPKNPITPDDNSQEAIRLRYQMQGLLAYMDLNPDGPGTDSPQMGWGDRANLKFNHESHIDEIKVLVTKGKTEQDNVYQTYYQLANPRPDASEKPNKRFMELSQLCTQCHTTDSAGKYMDEINYNDHCKNCHELLYDNERFPGAVVPHEDVNIVRGFLTDKYTLAVLDDKQRVQPPVRPRGIPGRHGGNLTETEAQRVNNEVSGWMAKQVQLAEELTNRKTHGLLGAEARGGCAYCHQMEPSKSGDWQTAPTNIPDRWLRHSRFSHEAHQMMKCVECHAGVGKSKLTADVLLPAIASCRKCHTKQPQLSTDDSIPRHFGARSDCAECHIYHNHGEDNFVGWLDSELKRDKPKPIEIRKDKNSK